MALSGELIALVFSLIKDDPRGFDVEGYGPWGRVYQDGAERGERSPIQQVTADLVAKRDQP